jgi:hypothetical protein
MASIPDSVVSLLPDRSIVNRAVEAETSPRPAHRRETTDTRDDAGQGTHRLEDSYASPWRGRSHASATGLAGAARWIVGVGRARRHRTSLGRSRGARVTASARLRAAVPLRRDWLDRFRGSDPGFGRLLAATHAVLSIAAILAVEHWFVEAASAGQIAARPQMTATEIIAIRALDHIHLQARRRIGTSSSAPANLCQLAVHLRRAARLTAVRRPTRTRPGR